MNIFMKSKLSLLPDEKCPWESDAQRMVVCLHGSGVISDFFYSKLKSSLRTFLGYEKQKLGLNTIIPSIFFLKTSNQQISWYFSNLLTFVL